MGKDWKTQCNMESSVRPCLLQILETTPCFPKYRLNKKDTNRYASMYWEELIKTLEKQL